MSEQPKKPQTMAEEVAHLQADLEKREQQLDLLERKLTQADRDLGFDLESIDLPPNMGAILREEPKPVAEENHQGDKKPLSVSDEPQGQVIAVDVETERVRHGEFSPIQAQRDPAVLELLNQSAGLVQRNEHLRISVENLDKKLDAMARELHHWREQDARRAAEAEAAPSQILGMSGRELKRLITMGFVFFLFVLLWHFITD